MVFYFKYGKLKARAVKLYARKGRTNLREACNSFSQKFVQSWKPVGCIIFGMNNYVVGKKKLSLYFFIIIKFFFLQIDY